MKRLAATLALSAALLPFTAAAHTDPDTPAETAARVIVEAATFERLHPEQATNCAAYTRPTRTSAIATCYGWSGSGNYTYQVAALAFDGCNRYIWFYGNVAWPYIRGKTTNGKQSVVYTPPGKWHFVHSTVVVHKP